MKWMCCDYDVKYIILCRVLLGTSVNITKTKILICIEIKCSEGSLPKVTKGDFLCPTHIAEGDVCSLTCHEGFYTLQSKQAVCGAGNGDNGGKWFGGNFSCPAISKHLINLNYS